MTCVQSRTVVVFLASIGQGVACWRSVPCDVYSEHSTSLLLHAFIKLVLSAAAAAADVGSASSATETTSTCPTFSADIFCVLIGYVFLLQCLDLVYEMTPLWQVGH